MTDKELFGISEQLNDTISRQAAIDEIKAVYEWHDMPTEERMIQHFKVLPSAQQERKKGKWIYHSEIGWGDTWLCDQCGEKTTSTVMGKPRANFCPNCGADMRKDGEQHD